MMMTQAADTETRHPLSAPLILASGSPRRRELLGSLNLEFTIIKPDVDEEAFNLDHLSPGDTVQFLARTKAQEVFKRNPHAIVIGADTLVFLNDRVFGKPKTEAEAFDMLNTLQGQTHEVYTGITIFHPSEAPGHPPMVSEALCSKVSMRPLTPAEIHAYIATGEPMDKAGSYAIQGFGATLIEKVDGCYFNVVGLSLYGVSQMLAQFGESVLPAQK